MKTPLFSPLFFVLLLLASAPPVQADRSDWVQVQRFERQLAEARQGKLSAMYEVGRMYERGRGVDVDLGKAAQWYQQAASAGNAPAQARLGILYFEGRGVAQDHQRAYTLLKKAAQENIPAAQYQLGLMYEWGTVVRQDPAAALNWYQQAASNGDYRAENKIRQLRAAARKKSRQAQAAPAPRQPAAKPRTGTTSGEPNQTAAKPARAPASGKGSGALATILQGPWSIHDLPAAILPSPASECSLKADRIHCRGKQQRNTDTEIIVYESEAVLDDFQGNHFRITYTNTVLEVNPKESNAGPLDENDSAPVT
ncbi:MAG TPA: sel1 repeat family protein, partial [Chromatiales bacterium]|nr:sel1 repeat family protein [Chromatiales bacterium]